MRHPLAPIALLALTACASGPYARPTYSAEVTDGNVLEVTCETHESCVLAAEVSCKRGYQVLKQGLRRVTYAEGTGTGQLVEDRHEDRGWLRVRCEGRPEVREARVCGYTCGPQPRDCSRWMTEDGCIKPAYWASMGVVASAR